MKRLFRTSKNDITPLSPPPPPPPDISGTLPNGNAAYSHGASADRGDRGMGMDRDRDRGHVKKSSSGMRLSNDPEQQRDRDREAPREHKMFGMNMGGLKHLGSSNVTPFPVDMGRGGGKEEAPKRRGSKRDKHSAPTLLEMRGGSRPQSATQQLPPIGSPPPPAPMAQSPPMGGSISPPRARTMPLPPPGAHRHPEHESSGDSWTIVHPHSPPNAAYPDYPPLAIPNAPAMSSSPNTGRSSPSSLTTPTQANLYLPPGARPPTPPTGMGGRPGTPTRPGYGTSFGRSQSSLASAGGGGGYEPAEVYGAREVSGRDRGYSSASASGRLSENESTQSHSHSHSHGHSAGNVPSPQKLSKNAPHPTATRSPLANTYPADLGSSPPMGSTAFPTPQPLQYAPAPTTFPNNPYTPVTMTDEMRDMHLGQDASRDRERERERDKKEKKGFLATMGMGNIGWGNDRKDKDKDRRKDGAETPHRTAEDVLRRGSIDNWQDANLAGHPVVDDDFRGRTMEQDRRGRTMGVEQYPPTHQPRFIPPEQQKDATAARDVVTAIQILCGNPDPSFTAIYDVCDRINHSDSPESVAKETARGIRKQFKHGNESERRAAAQVWLFMMKNISSKAFRPAASSKKFLGALEPILLASPGKELVSNGTYAVMADVVGDLTWHYGGEKGCEGLQDLWKKIKGPNDPDGGRPLPENHTSFQPEAMFPPQLFSAAVPVDDGRDIMDHGRTATPDRFGPSYANLPSHGDDMRRLLDESTAAKESARVLSEALVFTRPEDLEDKPIIRGSADEQEFYNKCFHAHESLTNQIEWAQAEAKRSRERVSANALVIEPGHDDSDGSQQHHSTIEEEALASLFEAHGMLAEALKQHDDLERLAMDERELKEVRERSKKDIKMDRNNLLGADLNPSSSSSRSPSPAPHARLPSPRAAGSVPLPIPANGPASLNPFTRNTPPDRSRTPSPDSHPWSRRGIDSGSPRGGSPLGRNRLPGPRPLPNPFKLMNGNNASNGSLRSAAGREVDGVRSNAGSVASHGEVATTAEGAEGEDEGQRAPVKPSRKALGKRKAVVDEDNDFNPDDMFLSPEQKAKKEDSDSSEESVTADSVFFAKPVKYAYDAYQEKVNAEEAVRSAGVGGSGSGSGGGGSGA